VAGGGQIYASSWDRLDTLEITAVDAEPVGDVLFPTIGSDWHEADRDEHDGFSFITFRRQSD
jgi:dihydrofolate reductase